MAIFIHRVVRGEERIGLGVAHGDRRLQGEDARVVLWAIPDVGHALFDVGLAETKREEGDVPVRAGRECGGEVVVDDAAIRAAIVIRDAKARAGGHGK